MFSSDEILKQLNPKILEDQVYEIQVNCLKMKRQKKFKNKKGYQQGAKYYKTKRPLEGKMNIQMFCIYCENDYSLLIRSKGETKFNYLWHSFVLIVFLLPFFSWGLNYGYVGFPALAYYLNKMRLKWNIYVKPSNSHSSRVIREYYPIHVNFG
ncbi:MAG: hypothetical protein HeimC2_00550 [Candidatus Heimdallarchaeota archaeon LC_2]|nr:MAG: hypothetical protein HeimC2_00550 [Candidatus Heimdallarchaeota archaeon LC_2]